MPSLTSLVGAATAAYSAALVASPRILIGPCGLEDSPDTRTLARALGVRDAAIGLAMIAVPAGRARQLATAARVMSDWAMRRPSVPAWPVAPPGARSSASPPRGVRSA